MVFRILLKVSQYAIMVIFLSACSSERNPLESDNPLQYAMFFLADSTLSYSDIENIPVDNLRLCETPFLTHQDIDTFRVFYIKNNPIQSYEILLKDSAGVVFANKVRPFLLVLGGVRYSIGEYWPAFMSIIPKSILMYRAFHNRYDIHPGDSVGNEKLKYPQILKILENVGVAVCYENIGK